MGKLQIIGILWFGLAAPLLAEYGDLPLAFEAAASLPDAEVRFVARTPAHVLLLKSSGGLRLEGETAIEMSLLGANPTPRVEKGEPLPGKAHYLLGNDPHHWITNIPTFARIEYHDVYPGVTLAYYGKQKELEYDFVLAPGISPGIIRLSFNGIDSMRIDEDGNLVLRTPSGVLRHHRPRVYQSGRQELSGRYTILGPREVGFEIDAYDPSQPLTVDPTLGYSTYLGGSEDDRAYGIAVDPSGCVYITGETWSVNYPRQSAYQGSSRGERDVFVTKLNAAGTAVVYSTYLGGSSRDSGRAIAVDAYGKAYVAGFTYSANFPTTAQAFRTGSRGLEEGFITKLNASGTGLEYSTYLGGSGSDFISGIAVNSAGEAWIAGYTSSFDFPAVSGPVSSSFKGGAYDAFAAKINASGSVLLYSTYLGGSGNDTANAVAVDGQGCAYITGQTDSRDFPTRNPIGGAAGGNDAFAVKLDAAGQLAYATYLGGTGSDFGNAIAVDSTGAAYIAGSSSSFNFPVTAGAYQTALRGVYDAFVAKLSPAGTALVYSTYLGGSDSDEARGIALVAGGAVVAGYTFSMDFPVQSAMQAKPAGNGDGFIAALDLEGKALQYSTYLGGPGADAVQAAAADGSGSIYVAGYTLASGFPVSAAAFQGSFAGKVDAFVTKIGANLPPTAVSVTPASGSGISQSFTFRFSDPNGDLSWVVMLIGPILNGANACMLIYDRASSGLFLFDDAGAAITGTRVGVAGKLENSQCSIDTALSSASVSGNDLSVTVQITFKPSFLGPKNVYMLAFDANGANSGYQARGTWTVPGTNVPPTAVSVTPASGSGISQSFTFRFSDANGDLSWVVMLISPILNGANACMLIYDRASSGLFLFDDASATTTGTRIGVAGKLENSQCSIDTALSSASVSGNDLSVTVQITFKPSFLGPKNVYMLAFDANGANSGYQARGTWTVPGTNLPPTAVSVTPNSGTGTSQPFTFRFSDVNGDLSWVVMLISPILDGRNACMLIYDRASSMLFLFDDSGATTTSARVGVAGTLGNNQCSIDMAQSSAAAAGIDLSVTAQITFKPSFQGPKNIYMLAFDANGASSGYCPLGAWIVP